MAVQVAEEDFKRRARRRLMGAVALTLLAVIVLPLVLDKEPPPAGPLNIQMPPSSATPAPVNPIPAAPNPPAVKTVPGPAAPSEQKSDPGERTAQGEYSVQVGAFTDAANVNRIKARIGSLGLPAFTDRLDGKTRVRAGPFPNKASAQRAADRLAAVGLPAKLEGP